MKWVPQDIEMVEKAKEYVDTAVVALIPVSFGESMKDSASMAESLTMQTVLLERQFTGRLLLLPQFTYLKEEGSEHAKSSLKAWHKQIQQSGFEHIFYLTSDSEWKLHEKDLGGSLLWVPALPFDQMQDSQKWAMADNQVKQLVGFFTQAWKEKTLDN